MPHYKDVAIYNNNGRYEVVILSKQQDDNRVFFIANKLDEAFEQAFEAVDLVRRYNLFN